MLVLPVEQTSAWFEFGIELEGVVYHFTFRFNDRDGAWYFDITNARGDLLAQGLKAVSETPLLMALRTLPGLPPGELIVRDTAGLDEEPTFDSLGRRHLMMYLTAAELAELGA